MKILVTGCFGFIGYNFINYLKKNNIDHIGVDSLESSSSKQLYKINNGYHVWFDFLQNGKNTNQLIWNLPKANGFDIGLMH